MLQAPGHRAPSQKLATVLEGKSEDMELTYVLDDSASLLSDSSHADLHGDESTSQSRRHTGSIASTYWRPERRDRTELSSVLDDRCVLDKHVSDLWSREQVITPKPSVDGLLPLSAH